ncbi:sensor histidine kinase [Pacificoceanicola onchidii]|uniref:sensor histidine kinase n=1 Tax=Pacificoceanicola onchidii TaxID=2562685 RepID=UPI0010A67DD1|nr:ATP-binding protein [Pacificoceanicola onchidii]
MLNNPIKRGAVALLSLGAAAGLCWGVWSYGYGQALSQVAGRAESDLALASDRLVTELQRYQMAAVLMSGHPGLAALHTGGDRARADRLLLETTDKTGALTAIYLDTDGVVLASAFGEAPAGLAQSRYFERALHGALGSAYGWDLGFGQRTYVYAAPSFATDGSVQGVLIVAVDIDDLEEDWGGSNPAVFFRDGDARIFLTNRSELLGWRRTERGMAPPAGLPRLITSQQMFGVEIWQQSLSPYVPTVALHLEKAIPVIDMTGEVLLDTAPARSIANLQAAAAAALCLFFGALLSWATARRRALAEANVELEARVHARTEDLTEANTQLRREVSERLEAEAALKRAQDELVQAGKLSALGQMSAGISHELNQPLMAIQQYAENGEAFLARGKPEKAGANLGRIGDLAGRAARIIKNLRAFARNESEPMGRVDLIAVIDTAVELTEARLRGDGVTLDWQRPEGPVYALGGEVRLGQVFVNLINNAADAMAGQPDKQIVIRLDADAELRVLVQDSGPGIADPEKVFEPFYSTKEVGGGMGLGLSISYGLVQSFGGNIRGTNTEHGALFTVELEYWREEAAA